jgi:hypothetical protein
MLWKCDKCKRRTKLENTRCINTQNYPFSGDIVCIDCYQEWNKEEKAKHQLLGELM